MKNLTSDLLSIDEIGDRISQALKKMGWKVSIVTHYYRDYMRLYATKRPGILDAFVIMQVILRTLDSDPNFVDIIFLFYADPNITGRGRQKAVFGKKARANDAEVFRKYCEEIFNLSGIKAEFDGWESNRNKITLYYIKHPIKKSLPGFLAKPDRILLIKELAKGLQNLGYEIYWEDPVSGAHNKEAFFFVKPKALKEFFSGILTLEDVIIEIWVQFDRIEVIFHFEDDVVPDEIELPLYQEKIYQKFSAICEKFPQFRCELDEEGLFMYASFNVLEKEAVLSFFKILRDLIENAQ